MKKFSFLLIGAFLLGTITFVLAEETKALTGSSVETPNYEPVTLTAEVATGETIEATTGDTVEVMTGDTVEVMTGNAEMTGDTTEVDETTAENTDTTTSTGVDSAKAKYSEEQVTAYEWSLEKGITTINDIEKARLSDGLTRAELAKMMSQYMTKVLGKTPVEAEKVNYADVDESLGDLADFIQIAYAYKIMGINADGTPLNNFNPNRKVTRAEYATVFSRVLFGDKYNKSEGNYYEDHLAALKEAGILTNDTPTIQEVRGWVMLMMYRSINNESSTTIGMPNPASVYCKTQGGTINIVKDEEGNEKGMCKLADGTEVEEWEYYRANNTGAVEPLYTEEDLKSAEKVINEEGFGKMTIKVENIKLAYMGDEKATSELEYCKTFEESKGLTVDECAVFESEFFIPEQDAQMAGAFEPNTTLTGYQWYLGRTKGGEWKILTMGY